LNPKGILDDATVGRGPTGLPLTVENLKKMRIAREQSGVVASLTQLETIDAWGLAAKQPNYCHVV
jgi:hypothetical protein